MCCICIFFSIDRYFCYLIDEAVIIKELYQCAHKEELKQLKANEFLLIMDTICPQLFDRLNKVEFSNVYPIRSILIYETEYRELHARYEIITSLNNQEIHTNATIIILLNIKSLILKRIQR